MSEEITIKTNNVPRDILDAWELTPAEQADFDYLDWAALEEGSESASFFRYRGSIYDLGEFMPTGVIHREDHPFHKWGGYISDSFFSGVLIRYVERDYDWYVVVGTFYA